MTNRIHAWLAFALSAALAPGLALSEVPPAVQPGNVVRTIAVTDVTGGVELAIRGTRNPSYTVFKLQDPPRLVIDLAGADVSAIVAPVDVGRSGVRDVTAAQYRDAHSSVGRIIVGLDGAPKYEVSARGEAVVVKVTAGESIQGGSVPLALSLSKGEVARGTQGRGSTGSPRTEDSTQGRGSTGSPRTEDSTQGRGSTGSPRTEDSTQSRGSTSSPRTGDSDNVLSRRVDESEISHPATTITGARSRSGGVKLDLDGEVARFEVIELSNPSRLAIDLYDVKKVPRDPVSVSGAFSKVRFGRDTGKVRVVLDAAGELPRCEVKRVKGGLAVVPVTALAANEKPSVRPEPVEGGANGESSVRPEPVEGRSITAEAAAAAAAGQGASYTISGPVHRREYTGRRITLDFHDIDIRNLLRLIADVSKKNIVVADDVTGKVTVSLRNVPWDQALDLVLRSKGLDKEEMGNVIRIAKVEAIAKEQQARAEAAKAREPLIPLKVRLLPVNFARAGDVATRVKDVLSDRGTVSTDQRTNVLIVKDVPEALSRAEGLVRNLDTATPQVRIESRIVEASSNYNRALGVQWGGNATLSPGTGNPTGLFFPNIVNAGGAAGGLPTIGTTQSMVPGYAVNLPAAIGQGSGGGIGFTFGSASGAFNLNLVLSALENSGEVKTISAPSVSTVDNKEATIGQGLSIPFSQVSASGVNTVFVEAKLELKVTPHVSADGSVLMKIKVTNNAPNPQLTGANGQPSISKREAETETIVKDGETTVIGGIYTRQTSSHRSEVPFLGKIPLLGYFFRTNSEEDDHTELLVFITPRIINRLAAAPVTP